jgi:hypothetical protein
MNRRNFIEKTGIGAFGLLGLNALEPFRIKALAAAPNLTITKIETVRFSPTLKVAGSGVQWMWLRMHTN